MTNERASTTELRIGDIVYLNSGGPELTVSGIVTSENETIMIVVAWFIKKHTLCTTALPAACFVKDKEVECVRNLIGD